MEAALPYIAAYRTTKWSTAFDLGQPAKQNEHKVTVIQLHKIKTQSIFAWHSILRGASQWSGGQQALIQR